MRSSRVSLTGFGSFVSRPIGGSLAAGALEQLGGALEILDAEDGSVIPAKDEFDEVTHALHLF